MIPVATPPCNTFPNPAYLEADAHYREELGGVRVLALALLPQRRVDAPRRRGEVLLDLGMQDAAIGGIEEDMETE